MQIHTIKTTLTFSPGFVQRLKFVARERHSTMSRLIEDELNRILQEYDQQKLSKMYAALRKGRGTGSHGITDTSQTIDDTLYGEDGVWKGQRAA